MLRTVYFPLVRRGTSKLPALLVVFFVSAVMHELAVGVPLRTLRGWAFIGMMMQVGWGGVRVCVCGGGAGRPVHGCQAGLSQSTTGHTCLES
jgi:hypothetical protein